MKYLPAVGFQPCMAFRPRGNKEGRGMDPFLAFIEHSDLSLWIRGESLLAFPAIITLHTICMGFLAGGSTAIDLRILGMAPGIPLRAMVRFYPLLWLAFAVNVTTGILLVIGYPTKQLTNPIFYIKLSFVALAVVLLYRIGADVLRTAEADPKMMTRRAKWLASASISAWLALIIAGRLLEYTQKYELLGVRAVH
jgi:hypothetical protein